MLLVLIPGLIWGASFLFIAEGLRSIGPNGVAFVRILIGFMTLALFPRAWKSVPPSEWLGIVVVGTLWMGLPLALVPHAEQYVSSAITGMLNAAVPLFAAIVATIVARQLPPRGVLAGLVVVGIAYVLITVAAGRVGATRASANNFLIPPVALLLGVTLRGEHVARLAVAGAAVAVTGAWLMQRARLSAPSTRLLLPS